VYFVVKIRAYTTSLTAEIITFRQQAQPDRIPNFCGEFSETRDLLGNLNDYGTAKTSVRSECGNGRLRRGRLSSKKHVLRDFRSKSDQTVDHTRAAATCR
jgi:hypothetical protein